MTLKIRGSQPSYLKRMYPHHVNAVERVMLFQADDQSVRGYELEYLDGMSTVGNVYLRLHFGSSLSTAIPYKSQSSTESTRVPEDERNHPVPMSISYACLA